jgi:hypothetical protein
MTPQVFVVDTNVLSAGLITIDHPPDRASVISFRTYAERVAEHLPAAK